MEWVFRNLSVRKQRRKGRKQRRRLGAARTGKGRAGPCVDVMARVVCKLQCQRPWLTALPPCSCVTPSELFPLFNCNLDLYLYLCAGIGVKLKQVMDGSTWMVPGTL